MSISWVLTYSLAKAGEPAGEPTRWKPVVSLVESGGPRISMSFILAEYLEMVSEIEVASVGLIWWRSGSGEWAEVEVRMRVFIGLAKHPSGAPMVANWSQRNCRSTRGMHAKTLLT